MNIRNLKHWLRYSRIYGIWYSIQTRCYNNKCNSYKDYWWRWIVCLWNNFDEFYRDMIFSYNESVDINWTYNTTIERINNDGNYCKDNCRRATRKEQQNNNRWNHWIEYDWLKLTISDWSKRLSIPLSTLINRLDKWSIERALTEPLNIEKSRKHLDD